MRRRLDSRLEPTQMLRVFRGQDGLFGLIGSWYDERTVVGFSPARRLAPDADPFDAVTDLPELVCTDGGARAGFGGGWVGALGYPLGGRLENLTPSPPRPLPSPDASLAFYDHVLVRDGEGWWFEALVDDANRARVEAAYTEVGRLIALAHQGPQPYRCSDFIGTPDAAGHLAAVATTLDHLAVGDIFQANVCRRFEAEITGDPLDLFCAGVDRLAPAYAAFLRTPHGTIASLSPELFLRRVGRHVRTAPIKGTAPLAADVADLVASGKDRAENMMIVDLMRNDLGRVCEPGSVRVTALARPERRAGVWHLVSDVVGTLAPDEDDGSLLRATFPPGSVTGAPKVRAMQVIHQVEATGRETYTGAIGYVSPLAGLELNVAIRTFEVAAGRVWVGVGGGVVVDSTPTGELQETLVKMRPLMRAIGARLSPADDIATPPAAPPSRPAGPHVPASTHPAVVDLAQGVFTTMLVEQGRAVELASHLDRLGASVARIYGMALDSDLERQVRLRASLLPGRQRLRINVRPDAGIEGATSTWSRVITTSPVQAGEPPPLDLRTVVVPGGLGADKYVDRRRLDDHVPGLVTDVDGSVLETWRGNIFVVTDGAVLTPALDGRVLPGVTRRLVLDALVEAGVPVVERRIGVSDLSDATEVFATGSVDRVRPVVSIDGVAQWAVGPTATWLSRRVRRGRTSSADRPEPGATTDVELLLVDNYDSFVYNIDQYVRELGARTHVVRSDGLDLEAIAHAVRRRRLGGIVISPGPGKPADAGLSTRLVELLGPDVPILGVCLGHQCIAEAYGARVVAAETVVHGKASLVHHDGRGVFDGLDGPLLAGRYHSLLVAEESLPADLVVTARTGSGLVMGVRHREHPVEGVQFHPESILSRDGYHLLAAFLRTCRSRPPHRARLSGLLRGSGP